MVRKDIRFIASKLIPQNFNLFTSLIEKNEHDGVLFQFFVCRTHICSHAFVLNRHIGYFY